MSYIAHRAKSMLDVQNFNHIPQNGFMPEFVGKMVIFEPNEENEEILRIPIQQPNTGLQIPNFLEWTREFIDRCLIFQKETIQIQQAFMYLTVRRGKCEIVDDDKWHTDGFSMNINHLPEQNYIFTNNQPTQFLPGPFEIPNDFDPLKHHLHEFINDYLTQNKTVISAEPNSIYCIDPYIVHRKPKLDKNIRRLFLRLTLCQIEIQDDLNAHNPLLPSKTFNRIGHKIRNSLQSYKKRCSLNL